MQSTTIDGHLDLGSACNGLTKAGLGVVTMRFSLFQTNGRPPLMINITLGRKMIQLSSSHQRYAKKRRQVGMWKTILCFISYPLLNRRMATCPK
jgi:hypothetical protein